MFQSQARSQATGDLSLWFAMTRDRGVSISGEKPGHWRLCHNFRFCWIPSVSISGEKPGHWRHHRSARKAGQCLCFNLRREARPLATSHRGRQSLGPLCFNLRREARPLATASRPSASGNSRTFQSQARSQATGDRPVRECWRGVLCFNLRREARPLATRSCEQTQWNRSRVSSAMMLRLRKEHSTSHISSKSGRSVRCTTGISGEKPGHWRLVWSDKP
jgi:hypothetical protein